MKRILVALLLVGALGLVWLFFTDSGGGSPLPPLGQPAIETDDEQGAQDDSGLKESAVRKYSEQRSSVHSTEQVDDAFVTYSVQIDVTSSRASYGEPVPGVNVELGFAIGRAAARRGENVTVETQVDDAGSATVELAVPVSILESAAQLESVPLVLWGAAKEAGYKYSIATVLLPVDSLDLIKMRVVAAPGGTLRGRVLKADGKPASLGSVVLCTLTDALEFNRTVQRTSIDKRGYFAIQYRKKGPRVIHAWADGLGAVTSEVLPLDFGIAPELELTLAGNGVVAGRIVGEDGEGYPHHLLAISPVSEAADSRRYPSFTERLRRQWGGGLTNFVIWSREDGSFRFAGLRPGTYEIQGLDPAVGDYSVLLTTESVRTDKLDLELLVSGYRLFVHVLDHEGAPLKRLALAHDSRQLANGRRQSPLNHMLYCEPCDVNGVLQSAGTSVSRGRSRVASRAVVLDVEPGKSYVVGVVSETNQLAELVVHIPRGDLRTERTLQLAAPVDAADFAVQVIKPSGEPFRGRTKVRLYAPISGRLLLSSNPRLYNGEFLGRLGAGSYRVEVSASPRPESYDPFYQVAAYAMNEELIELHAGQENRFEIRLAARGLLELLVSLEPGVSRPSFDLPSVISRTDPEPWRLSNRGVLARLEPVTGGSSISLEFSVHWEGRPVIIGDRTEEPWFPIDQSCKSTTPIPIGEYDLILSPSGFREIRRRVTFAEGEAAKLEFTLTEQDLLD